ncbi:MAG: flagellar hook-basal body complex protein FliE [Curvibacter sp.]|nr:flagellar hook-basal body complex protein FliE [Curvibacter sp.]
MTSERIQIPQLNIVEPGVSAQAGGGFGSLFVNGLEKVNQGLLANQTELQALAVGDRVGLHQVMIRMEESRLNFQLMMQVRGRLLDAYQDVMKMQV